jgi:hypothetical protein
MSAKNQIDPAILRQVLNYDHETGDFCWLQRPREMFKSEALFQSWNKCWAGKPALTADLRGYRQGHVFGRHVTAHRVAWAIYYGEWPTDMIDHINGNPSDNRIVNLREASPAGNSRNVKRSKANTSGYKGVSFINRDKVWQATIHVNGKSLNLGHYKSAEDAYAAYCKASRRFHGEFGRVA